MSDELCTAELYFVVPIWENGMGDRRRNMNHREKLQKGYDLDEGSGLANQVYSGHPKVGEMVRIDCHSTLRLWGSFRTTLRLLEEDFRLSLSLSRSLRRRRWDGSSRVRASVS